MERIQRLPTAASEIRFECSAVKKKDAHQLCAAAALKHFQLD